MLSGLEQFACQDLAVPAEVMEHVVRVESSFNPYAIGVVGARLVRQPNTLREALATVGMLERQGYNFSLGLAQVNRYNLANYGLPSYEAAFRPCPNLRVGARILAECRQRSGGDWGKAFSCYYSGNAVTGFRHGYVQKIFASMRDAGTTEPVDDIGIGDRHARIRKPVSLRDSPGDDPARDWPSAAMTPMPAQPMVAQPSAPQVSSPSPAPAADAPGDAPDHAFVF